MRTLFEYSEDLESDSEYRDEIICGEYEILFKRGISINFEVVFK